MSGPHPVTICGSRIRRKISATLATARTPDNFSRFVTKKPLSRTEDQMATRDPAFRIGVVDPSDQGVASASLAGFSIKISPRSSVSPGLTVNSLRIGGPFSRSPSAV
jgi:hypothetical protein